MIAAIFYVKSFCKKHKIDVIEQGMMLWWTTNLFFFHIHCDVLSGYYQVMPAMTQLYAHMTPAHLKPQWADARLHLDATYFLEMTVEAPLAALCLCLYLRRHPARHLMEIAAVSVQAAGTMTYYVPPLIRGEVTPSWVCFCDRGFGAVWIIFPLIVIRRHWMAASDKKQQ